MEYLTYITWLDLIVIIILLRSTYVGLHRGFFCELFYITGISLAIIYGIHYYPHGANFIEKYLFIPLNISNLISFLIIILIFYIGFRIIYGLFRKVIKIEIRPVINKIGGPLLGFCRGFLISTLLLLIMLLTPIGYITESAKTKSLFGSFFIKTGVALYKKGLSIVSSAETRELTQFLSGAEPLKFKIFKFKKRDRLEEML